MSTPIGRDRSKPVLGSAGSLYLPSGGTCFPTDLNSDSDSFVFFVLVGRECTCTFLGATFFGEGDLSFNKTWPYMYGRSVVIRLLDKTISSLNDSWWHESFTNKSFAHPHLANSLRAFD